MAVGTGVVVPVDSTGGGVTTEAPSYEELTWVGRETH